MLTFPQVQRDAAQSLSDRVDGVTDKGRRNDPVGITLLPSNPLPNNQLCCYWNHSSQVQVIRIEDVRNFFERVVFPGQRLLFEAPLDQILKIYYGRVAVLQVNEIACNELQVRFE